MISRWICRVRGHRWDERLKRCSRCELRIDDYRRSRPCIVCGDPVGGHKVGPNVFGMPVVICDGVGPDEGALVVDSDGKLAGVIPLR